MQMVNMGRPYLSSTPGAKANVIDWPDYLLKQLLWAGRRRSGGAAGGVRAQGPPAAAQRAGSCSSRALRRRGSGWRERRGEEGWIIVGQLGGGKCSQAPSSAAN
jgi:hypothetical protein